MKHCYETDEVFAKHVFNIVSIMYKKGTDIKDIAKAAGCTVAHAKKCIKVIEMEKKLKDVKKGMLL